MIDETAIRLRFATLDPVLDERGRRRFAAAEALSAGRGGIAAVSRATGLARSTIGRALGELRGGEKVDGERVRRAGGGRKPVSETDASLLEDLRSLLEPTTRGDPQSPLLWTCKSLRKLCQSLRDMGHTVGRTVVGDLLRKFDYSLQSNRKTREGSNHPDRDAQFLYINDRVKEAPQFRDDEVMNADFLRRALRSPLAPGVFEVADQLLLLGVDGDRRFAQSQRFLDAIVDGAKLRVAAKSNGVSTHHNHLENS